MGSPPVRIMPLLHDSGQPCMTHSAVYLQCKLVRLPAVTGDG